MFQHNKNWWYIYFEYSILFLEIAQILFLFWMLQNPVINMSWNVKMTQNETKRNNCRWHEYRLQVCNLSLRVGMESEFKLCKSVCKSNRKRITALPTLL